MDYYYRIIQNKNLVNSYTITIIRTLIGVVLGVGITSMGAYVVAKQRLYLYKVLNVFVLIPMLFGGGLIPFYLVIRQLNLTNSLMGLVIPFMVSAFNLFIMRNFMSSIPLEMEESATIDGANHFMIFWRIILPVSLPGLAVLTLLIATFHWNEFFWSGLLVSKRSLYTITVQLRNMLAQAQQAAQFQGMASSESQYTAAVTMVIVLPLIFLYPFIQKYFTKGIMLGAVKG